VAAAALLTAVALPGTGLGAEDPSGSDAATAAPPARASASSSERRVVLYGGDRDFYPYEWLDEGGVPHGFNIDLVNALGEVLGFEARFELDRWDRIRHAIEVERRIDLSDMYASETRSEVVDFAEPITVVWEQAWVRRGGADINGLEDLRGLRILVHRAGYIEQFLRTWDPTLTLIPVDSEEMGLQELALGHGDCALATQLVGQHVSGRPGFANLMPAGPPLLPRPYGLVVRKGDTAFLADINRGLKTLRASGRLDELEDRWLGTPEPPSPAAVLISNNLRWLLAGLCLFLAIGLAVTLGLTRKIQRQARRLEAELDERRRAEEALGQSREQFRLAFQNSPAILGISDLETGEYLDVNKSFEKVMGWSRAEAVGHTSRDLNLWAAPADRDRMREALARDGTVRDMEVVLRTRSGDLLSFLFIADLITLNGRRCIVTNALDISDRARWEKALRDSEERWKFALEGAGEGVWDWDVPSNLIYASRRYKEILGYPDAAFDLDPVPWRARVHPDDVSRLETDFTAYLEGRAPLFQTEVRMICRDGTFRWVVIRGRAVALDDRNHPKRVIGTIMDITDRRRAEEERTSLEDQLRQSQKMEVVGQLAGGIAHDFNNQLMVIRGYSDLLQNQGLDPRSQALLAEVVRATDRAATLTSRLLAFGRKQVRRLSVFNPNRVLSDMAGALGMMVGESIAIVVEAAPNLGSVRADRDQIEQVIANIAVNARDAMPGGGRLTIRTRNIVLDQEYARHHVGTRTGSHVLLSFQDSGVGMDEATAARIFEPFFTTKSEGLGSGLGLSIVYGIVKQSGGHVTVDSEPGRGSTFKVFLPRVDEVPADERMPARLPVERARTATVLFVEDDPNLFALLRGILESAGYEVLASPVPTQAIALAAQYQGTIDVLITDVVMPGMSGPDLAEHLQKSRPGIRLLFISGYPKDVLERQTVLPAGIHLLGKPFSPRDLIATIQTLLESPGAEGTRSGVTDRKE
jgi:PAS domain S-box-containing protein